MGRGPEYTFSWERQRAKRHTKRCSTSVIVKEMQIKTTMSYHLTPVRVTVTTITRSSVREGVQKRRPSCTVGGNVKLVQPLWKTIRRFPQKIKTGTTTCVLSFSHVRLFATPWTGAHQAPLSMEILQARILEWVAMPSPRWSSQPRARIQVSRIAGEFFTVWATREAHNGVLLNHKKEWNLAICDNMHGPRRCCTNWNVRES